MVLELMLVAVEVEVPVVLYKIPQDPLEIQFQLLLELVVLLKINMLLVITVKTQYLMI